MSPSEGNIAWNIWRTATMWTMNQLCGRLRRPDLKHRAVRMIESLSGARNSRIIMLKVSTERNNNKLHCLKPNWVAKQEQFNNSNLSSLGSIFTNYKADFHSYSVCQQRLTSDLYALFHLLPFVAYPRRSHTETKHASKLLIYLFLFFYLIF